MGQVIHEAIILTSWDAQKLERSHEKALELFSNAQVSPIVNAPVNNYKSFLIGPSGSKLGWPEADQHDGQLALFEDWVSEQVYEDGSSTLELVRVLYGEI